MNSIHISLVDTLPFVYLYVKKPLEFFIHEWVMSIYNYLIWGRFSVYSCTYLTVIVFVIFHAGMEYGDTTHYFIFIRIKIRQIEVFENLNWWKTFFSCLLREIFVLKGSKLHTQHNHTTYLTCFTLWTLSGIIYFR